MPKVEIELRHFCGNQGFGRSPYDLCPQCEFDRLTKLEVPEEIAKEAAWLRCFMNPSVFPPAILAQNQKEYEELEEKYGKKIP